MIDTQDTPDDPHEDPERDPERTHSLDDPDEDAERTETPYEREEQPGEAVERDPALGPPEAPGQPLPSGGNADPPMFPDVAGPGGLEHELQRSTEEHTAGPRQPPPESR